MYMQNIAWIQAFVGVTEDCLKPPLTFFLSFFFVKLIYLWDILLKKIRFNCDEDISNMCYIPINVMNATSCYSTVRMGL